MHGSDYSDYCGSAPYGSLSVLKERYASLPLGDFSLSGEDEKKEF